MQSRKHNAGFTMLEVLITLVILSIGLLGLAGLQATGMKNNHYAYMTTQAAQLAYDMGDRIRANMAGFEAGNYNSLSGVPGTLLADLSPDCESATCSPSQLATYDYAYWYDTLSSILPSGQGSVSVSAGVATISVMWDEDRTGATGTGCDPDDADDLKCFQVEMRI